MKLRKGNGKPTSAPHIAGDELFVDQSTGRVYYRGAGGGIAELAVPSRWTPPTVRVFDVTFPAINADTRHVETVSLGVLHDPDAVLLGYWQQSANDAKIEAFSEAEGKIGVIGAGSDSYAYPLVVKGRYAPQPSSSRHLRAASLMMVFADHQSAMRFSWAYVGEKYGAGAGTNVPDGFTYSDLGVGVLFGWYGLGADGVFDLDKKVELESAWVSQDESGNTVLHVALYNRDASASSAKTIKLAVYE